MIAIAYSVTLLVTSIYAICYGGREGRTIVGIIACLFVVSYVLKNVSDAPLYVMIASLSVDCLSLTLKTGLAFSSHRRWPINVAALQLVSVCMQIGIVVSPTFKLAFHDLVSTVWAIPTLIVITLGIALDHRHDRKAAGSGSHYEKHSPRLHSHFTTG